jgi:superfamily II DNA/RNA helicase
VTIADNLISIRNFENEFWTREQEAERVYHHISLKMASKEAPKKDPRVWENVNPPLSKWVLDAVNTMGFAKMTPVQASTIPLFMGNKDVVVEV